jgi:hypothetical protein
MILPAKLRAEPCGLAQLSLDLNGAPLCVSEMLADTTAGRRRLIVAPRMLLTLHIGTESNV